ncbi:MAG: hypothetical protein Q8Q09_10015 [Deltaproteobacteria bacterium]|nr:hypothetical protein [Deltaproteobacteria bacterium]
MSSTSTASPFTTGRIATRALVHRCCLRRPMRPQLSAMVVLASVLAARSASAQVSCIHAGCINLPSTYGAAVADTPSMLEPTPRGWGAIRWNATTATVSASAITAAPPLAFPLTAASPVGTTLNRRMTVSNEAYSPLALGEFGTGTPRLFAVTSDEPAGQWSAQFSGQSEHRLSVAGSVSDPDVACTASQCVGISSDSAANLLVARLNSALAIPLVLRSLPTSMSMSGYIPSRAAVAAVGGSTFVSARRNPANQTSSIELGIVDIGPIVPEYRSTVPFRSGPLVGSTSAEARTHAPIAVEGDGVRVVLAWIQATMPPQVHVASFSLTTGLAAPLDQRVIAEIAGARVVSLALNRGHFVLTVQNDERVFALPIALDGAGRIAHRAFTSDDTVADISMVGTTLRSHRLASGAVAPALAFSREFNNAASERQVTSHAIVALNSCRNHTHCALTQGANLCGFCVAGSCERFVACAADAGVDAEAGVATDASFDARDAVAPPSRDAAMDATEASIEPPTDAALDATEASVEPPTDASASEDGSLAMDAQIPEDSQPIRDAAASTIDNLRFKGGACACTVATHAVPPSRTGLVAALALALTCVRRRRSTARLTS